MRLQNTDVLRFIKKNRKIKRCICQRKNGVNEQLRRRLIRMWVGTRNLFWKEVSEVNGRKLESFWRIKDANGRLALGKDEV